MAKQRNGFHTYTTWTFIFICTYQNRLLFSYQFFAPSYNLFTSIRFIRTHLHNFCFPLNALSTPPHIISMPFLFLLQLLPHLSFILQFLLLPFLLQLLTPFIPFLFFLQLQPDILSFLLLLVLLILFLSFLFLLATPSRSRVVFSIYSKT